MGKVFLNPDKKLAPRFHQFIAMVKVLRKYHRHEVVGIENVPEKGRAILVINHAMVIYDIMMLWEAVYKRNGRYIRTLIDRFFYKVPLMEKTLLQPLAMGEAGWASSKELLNNEELILLSPGGMREWGKPSTQKYQINWHGRKGYAKLAIETQTPIILAACPKADDIYHVHDNPVSKMLYSKFKFPFVFSTGFAGSPMPKPVKLIHHLSEPIVPPARKDGVPLELQVNEFHAVVENKMNDLIQHALAG
jgi:1-acyl-sn-glycerol-3-phosphate acyltransferase